LDILDFPGSLQGKSAIRTATATSGKRVKWASTKPTVRDANGINWFEQVWFAGNHSDIGGSYCENESRLSDIALDWMLRWAVAIPNGIKFDPRVLSMWPHPEGTQHDEVASGFVHTRSSAGFTITTSGFKFSVHTVGVGSKASSLFLFEVSKLAA
jgi:Uncharacterized alpha/beta hydrolase domain (DUF2235)